MFNLANQAGKLKHINGREEKNVEVIAFDLKINVEMHNAALNMFHEHLLDAFYKIDPEKAQQDMVDEVSDNKTALKFLKLSPLAWNDEITECHVVIGYGIGGDSDIILNGCKVNDFKLTPKEGGTVSITFRVIAHPKEEDIGKMYSLLNQDIVLTVAPPAPTTVQELFD